MVIDLADFRRHVQEKSPAFVPLFIDQSRYQVAYGGAGSGKSHIVARKHLYRLLHEHAVKHNILIVRKVARTLRRSVFKLMCDLVNRWGLRSEFDINKTDLTLTYLPTGSAMIFSGLDDAEKIKSIEGVTSIWIEEATELSQDDFEQLDLRLRGDHGCLKQITLTLNPISEQHWIKRYFFDDPPPGVFTLKTTYPDNAFIDEAYKQVMESKKHTNPRYYNIYARGNWGTSEGLIFNAVTQRLIRTDEIAGLTRVQGLDFGYTNDPSAWHETYVDVDARKLYVFDGFYETGMSNAAIAKAVIEREAHKVLTVADSAEPKSIDYIRGEGVKIEGAAKGKDSVRAGLDYLLEYEIVVNAHLSEFMTEFLNYSWHVDRTTKKPTDRPADEFNHFVDALRYSMENLAGIGVKPKRRAGVAF